MSKEKGTRLAADFRPDADDIKRGEMLGLKAHQVDWCVRMFVDYFTGPDANRPVKKDWHRAFRNWMERDAWKARKIEAVSKSTPDANDQWRARLRLWIAKKFWPSFAGPKPDERGCYCPRHVLQEFGLV